MVVGGLFSASFLRAVSQPVIIRRMLRCQEVVLTLRYTISEFTPYELWCEELESGIPSWGIGKKFSEGRSLLREDGLGIPERQSIL